MALEVDRESSGPRAPAPRRLSGEVQDVRAPPSRRSQAASLATHREGDTGAPAPPRLGTDHRQAERTACLRPGTCGDESDPRARSHNSGLVSMQRITLVHMGDSITFGQHIATADRWTSL